MTTQIEQSKSLNKIISKPRLHTIDLTRGICMVLVMGYHLLYDIVVFTDISIPWMFGFGIETFRDCFVAVLIFISGFSSVLSKSNYKRGLKTLLLGFLITAVTMIFMPEIAIKFGILHFFGSMMIITEFISPLLNNLSVFISSKNIKWISVIFPLLFLLLYKLPIGRLLTPIGTVTLPRNLYSLSIGFIVGLPRYGFYSSDYYPLLPWGVLFIWGYVVGKDYKNNKFPAFLSKGKNKVLEYIGRNSLVVYFIHQPILLGCTIIYNYFSA